MEQKWRQGRACSGQVIRTWKFSLYVKKTCDICFAWLKFLPCLLWMFLKKDIKVPHRKTLYTFLLVKNTQCFRPLFGSHAISFFFLTCIFLLNAEQTFPVIILILGCYTKVENFILTFDERKKYTQNFLWVFSTNLDELCKNIILKTWNRSLEAVPSCWIELKKKNLGFCTIDVLAPNLSWLKWFTFTNVTTNVLLRECKTKKLQCLPS